MPGFYQLADDAPLDSQLLSCFKHIELTATLSFTILVYSNVISVPDSTDSCFIPRVPFCCRYLKSIKHPSDKAIRHLSGKRTNYLHSICVRGRGALSKSERGTCTSVCSPPCQWTRLSSET
jgi:hypothetical protein